MPGIENGPVLIGLVAVLGYLLGSVPFGLVIARLFGLGDLRQIGSGNIGATNVLRTGNKPAALATLLLDSGKGAIAVLIARHFLGETAAQVAGGAAFLGHLYPIWLGFKGGKGVATFLGTMLALAWPVGIAACLVWLATAFVSRISSLSALVAAAATVPLAYFLDHRDLMLLAAGLAVLIFWRHRQNIQRLATGSEPRIGKKG
ncbi:glycerol-3-phosphate 1-O-acyltransferase PlsY [Sedimentimonas flavescens]|uniref:Glycerol-3-phosphate acyltransferase n=1 Tax=Sedimentimonas flavescens TaxID=2851012 RepID=A0ABT3A1M3_9RHOB|nr:glycerol-3-phosphate 1-O-acyltransferase PlsY [Sedimentimonas flavescens]MCV2879882.1 glycerol-3-phosphate 1-O-acyltransferase PlsY [Sedimentimonas flavescens]WBL33415.1 glycerol-3-phosphate 1-O-acyltransferase PlsY [Sinirhodobacter sp. HNIBRBA609]